MGLLYYGMRNLVWLGKQYSQNKLLFYIQMIKSLVRPIRLILGAYFDRLKDNKVCSAAFFEDVPIPGEYKFEDREENISKIIEKIKDCFENFEERYKDFDYYREVIKNEPRKFLEDLRKIFLKVE